MKAKNKDTSKIYPILQELDNLLQSQSIINDEIKDKSKLLLELAEVRKKEDKGFNAALMITLICFFLSACVSVILYEKNQEKEWYVENLQEFMNIRVDSISNKETFSYRTFNGNKLTYNQLGNQKDSLEILSLKHERNFLLEKLKYDSLSNVLWKYKTVYEIVYKQYGITMRYSERKRKGKTVMSVDVDAAKVDSALLLLPKYGNKIRYNKKENYWTVE